MGRRVPMPPTISKIINEHGEHLRKTPQITTGLNWVMEGFISADDFNEYTPPQPPKFTCPWCHGETFDDERGHCIACGGPRDAQIKTGRQCFETFTPGGFYDRVFFSETRDR